MNDESTSVPSWTQLERWITMRRRLDAPPERTFRSWTDPEELARWYPDRIEGGLAAGARSVLVWPDERVWWDVLEVHPSNLFIFRRPWPADGPLETTVRLTIEPAGYGARLELRDGPFPLGQAGALDAWGRALEGWAEALMLLRAHLDFSVDLRPRR